MGIVMQEDDTITQHARCLRRMASRWPGDYFLLPKLKEHLSGTRNVSLMVGKRHLQRFLIVIGGCQANTPDLGDKMKVLEYAGIEVLSLIEAEIRISPDDSM
ncbi:hypothetical protein AVEN_124127-1 [Araneus ventricosus]|uniref:Uncharacterized protein n=1 Tax=Araneus ventricosus TaxID=182803 RepID=A0A4Y2I5C2_ARAVE|nr:hypothetical protein AVEN_124127-1 [Araneus ventricosus]